MSEIQVGQINSTDGATAITTGADGYVSFAKTQMGGRRNLIINGAMQVAQRGTSATGVTSNGYRVSDRFADGFAALGTWTIENTSDSPDDFSNSHKLTCTTPNASPASSAAAYVFQAIEAQNLQQLAFGTASAKEMTLSFYVKSNKTGTASLEVLQNDNSLKMFSTGYTINSADTWEYKTISIPADVSGVINNDNGVGLQIIWWLNSGSNFTGGTYASSWAAIDNTNRNVNNLSVGGTTNDYWQITGVQLEVGSVATPFEHRSYQDEFLACCRYFVKFGSDASSVQIGFGMSGAGTSNGHVMTPVVFPVPLRAIPADADVTYDNVQVCTGAACWTATKLSAGSLSTRGCLLQTSGTATLTNYETNLPYFLTKTGGGGISFDVEL